MDQPDAALDKAVAMVTDGSLARSDPATVAMLVQQLHAVAGSATLSRWPSTLFLATPDNSREERRFTVPDAGEGLIVAELDRQPSVDSATMGRAERRVTNEVAGTRRVTLEEWSLQRIDG